MPHLSPLNWNIIIFILLSTIAILSATTWWSQLPNFPSNSSAPNSHNFPQWPWT